MKQTTKYDPEDIESLMLHKSFSELYPEEREFVLRYMDSEIEYNNMRATLIKIMETKGIDNNLEPRAKIKEDLLSRFETEKKGGFIVWLNGILPFSKLNQPSFQWKPVLQIALPTLLLLFAVGYFLWNADFSSENQNIAEVKEKTEQKENKLEGKTKENEPKEEKKNTETAAEVETNEVAELDKPIVESEDIKALDDLSPAINSEERLNVDEEILVAELQKRDANEDQMDFDMDVALNNVEADDMEIQGAETLSKVVTIQNTSVNDISITDLSKSSNAGNFSDKNISSELNAPLSNDLDLISYLYTAP